MFAEPNVAQGILFFFKISSLFNLFVEFSAASGEIPLNPNCSATSETILDNSIACTKIPSAEIFFTVFKIFVEEVM